jgi:hypothetical protein
LSGGVDANALQIPNVSLERPVNVENGTFEYYSYHLTENLVLRWTKLFCENLKAGYELQLIEN